MINLQTILATEPTKCDICKSKIFVGKPYLYGIISTTNTIKICSIKCMNTANKMEDSTWLKEQLL